MKGYGIRQQTTGCSVVSGKVWESFQTVALGLPWWGDGSESTCQCWRHGFDSWSRKILHAAAQRHGPRLLKLACSRAPAHRRPWQWEAREPNYRGAPAPHRQKPVQQQRHSTTKTKIIKCSLKKKKWPEVPSVTEHLWSLGLAVFLSAPPISTSPSLPVLSAASERLPQPSCPGSGPSSEFSVASEFRDYYPCLGELRIHGAELQVGDDIVETVSFQDT